MENREKKGDVCCASSPKKGRLTIPTDASFVEGTKEIAALWGADAVRDCDGTSLPKNPHEIAPLVYKTYFVVRGDNEWAKKHPEEAHRVFLLSDTVTADSSLVRIPLLRHYLKDQFALDMANVHRFQAFDRTLGEEVPFEIDEKEGTALIKNAIPYHEYNVDFVARLLWHPTQIYNYLTNHWDVEKDMVYDPSFPKTRQYVKEHLKRWLEENQDVDVVRFTTFFYQFSLFFNEKGKEKYVDWFGYGLCGSPALLDGFKKESGIALTAEDLIQAGQYNNPFLVPNEKFRRYMDYVSRFCAGLMKELVEIVHRHGRKAMMFLGDDWIGTEPYGPYFADVGLDAVVGSIGGGVTVRMLSEIPGAACHEGRFLPYFFPDEFHEGNEQGVVDGFNKSWRSARRALLRKPLDRMGFGGYLSLAAKFPSFVDRVAEVADEFRDIVETAEKSAPYCTMKVGVLNAWGSLRSWMSHMVAHELWYQQIYSYQGVLEALSGLPVEVVFLSFDDVLRSGVPDGVDALINVGARDTSYSGGSYWDNPRLLEKIRSYVAKGHGFVGIGEPSAYAKDGHLFALRDVLGVDEELGFTLSQDKYNIEAHESFVNADKKGGIDYGEGTKNVYALDGTEVLDIDISPRFIRKVNVGEVKLAVNDYFGGRSCYIAGLPYNGENARLLYRALLYVSHKEDALKKAFSSNPNAEVSYYPEIDTYAVINNTDHTQETVFYDADGEPTKLMLKPTELRWIKGKK